MSGSNRTHHTTEASSQKHSQAKYFLHGFFLIALLGLLAACHLRPVEPLPTLPTPTPQQPTPATNQGWTRIRDGLEQRIFTPSGNPLAQMIAVRIDPTHFTFRAHYRPGTPLSVTEWEAELPQAAVIINANFFDPAHHVLGLLISDGIAYGRAYTDRGGTFYIQGGVPALRSNIAEPYRGEAFEQAVQGFPMLVLNSAQAFNNAAETQPSRRTVISQDSAGRIILLVTPGLGLGLFDLSAYLASLDVDLQIAFNLDGGRSTMMALGPSLLRLRSIDPVPAVLAVYPR